MLTVPSIPVLLGMSGPSAIAGLVVAVLVWVAIECFPLRSRPHILEEGNKVIPPLIAHLDATPAIKRVLLVIRVVAATLGMSPRFVL
jgi:hypothetical protein